MVCDTAKELHTRYLICLFYIYAAFERSLHHLETHPALATTYNPAILSRAPKLDQDIRYFLDTKPSEDWQDDAAAQMEAWPAETRLALKNYVARIEALAAAATAEHTHDLLPESVLPPSLSQLQTSSEASYTYPPPTPAPELLLAHSYVRYMGDMSGGQEIRKSIAAAYSLPLDSSDGQRFYDFGQKGNDVREIKQLKKDFRSGMDVAGAELTPAQLGKLLIIVTWVLSLIISGGRRCHV